MSLRVYLHDGGPFTEVESEEQAVRLMKLFGNGHRQLALNIPESEPTRSSEDAVREFFATINQNARGFLATVAKHPKGVEGDNLANEMNVETSVFGGILGGISKIADKHSFKTKAFIISQMRFEGARRFRHFQPGPLLLKHSQLLGEWVKVEVQKNVGA